MTESSAPPLLQVVQGVWLVALPRLFSGTVATEFRSSCAGWVAIDSVPDRVVLDFTRTELIDSTGLGALISFYKLLQRQSVMIEAWSVAPQVRLVFSLSGLDELIRINPDTEALLPSTRINRVAPVQPNHLAVVSRSKRCMDAGVGLLGLVATLLLLPGVALVHGLKRSGPVLVSKPCLGLLGRPFLLWSFSCSPAAARLLRRFPLHRLPESWSLLRGELSLIGPAPLPAGALDDAEPQAWTRLDVRPGVITPAGLGWWMATTGSAAADPDHCYVQQWSPWLDCRLLLCAFYPGRPR